MNGAAFDPAEATHRVVTRQPEGVSDWDETGRIAVENRVVAALVPYGTAVHLRVDSGGSDLGELARRSARVGEGERVLAGDGPEYRVRLPDGADTLLSALAVDPGDTDAWTARLHELHEFAVVTPDAWLYRSVPHHAHLRELNADGRDGALGAVADALDEVPRSSVVPADALASWRADGFEYELTWDTLRRRAASEGEVGGDGVGGGEAGGDDAGGSEAGGDDVGDGDASDGDAHGRWTVFDLDRLRWVASRPDRAELVARWRPVDSWSRRLLARVVRPASVDPPTRVAFPDRESMADAVAALERLRADLGYEFAVDDP